MKESTLATRVMIAVLCLGVAVYLAVYLVRGWDDDLATTAAYTYAQDLGVDARGIVVRDETVLPAADGYIDQILAEGERAAVGDPVVLLYSDASALSTRQSIRSLEAEIEQLEYALSTGAQSADTVRLDSQIISCVANLRSLAASGSLSTLEDSALSLRTMVFRRDFAYGGAAAADQLGQLIQDRRSRLAELNHSLNQVSRTVYASVSGVFSNSVDGWETLISSDMLSSLTADGLTELLSQRPAADTRSPGKLIRGSTWYFAALLPGADTGLQEGKSYPVSFSDGYYDQIPMTLERVELGENQTLAIFSARSHLSETTLLRDQTATVVTRQVQGIRIPRQALRVETETVEAANDETGEVTASQVNRYGVYTVVRSQAEWQEVEILYTADTYYLVKPANPEAANRLRAGDEIILNSSGMYHGKVVR